MTALTNKALLARLADATGVSQAAPDPTQATAPLVPLPQQIIQAVNNGLSELAGVPDYGAVASTRTAMRNDVLLQNFRAFQSSQQTINDATQQLLTALLAGADRAGAQVAVLTGQMQLAQLAATASDAKQVAYGLRLDALETKAVLVASATEANRLDIVKLQAADALLQARATTDEAAIAAAQATANQARDAAALAQKKADDDAAAVLVAVAKADTAQATASAAQQAQAAFAARFRSARVTLPQIPLGGTIDVVVTFAAFADANFTALAEPAGLTLLGLDATEVPTARTASTVTFKIKNVLGLVIAAGGVLNFIALHD
jgi:hypothetical protein